MKTRLLRIVLLVLLSVLPQAAESNEEKQFFIDMTSAYLPANLDPSSDADFGDINSDGWLDIFISNHEPSDFTNLIFLNNQGSSFTDESNERLPSGVHVNTGDADFGDIDRDGDLDVFISNWNADNQLLINNGSGYFSNGVGRLPSDSDSDCKDADFGDVDGDLDLDIIAANFNGQRNLLYINDGAGYFEISSHSRFPTGGENTNQNDFGDVDGDFDLDVMIANNTSASNQLLINDGSGYFTDETDARLPVDLGQSNDIELGDVDNDGDLDVLVINGFFPGIDRIWINDGTGYFSDETDTRWQGSNGAGTEGDLGDVDNDGDPDIIITNHSSGGLSTRLYINDGLGFFSDETYQRYPSEDDEAKDADFGDVDNDGDLDLFIANLGVEPYGEQNRFLINTSTPDSFPPTIPRTYHHPDTGDTTNAYLITTAVWDNISIVIGELDVSLSYRTLIDTSSSPTRIEFTEIPTLDCGGFLYRERIPAQSDGTIVEYYIKAEDKMGNISHDPPDAPDSVFSFLVDVNVGIGDDPPSMPSLPKTFYLSQNYPNPFNPSTTVTYNIPEGEGGNVIIQIFDIRGRLVRSLVQEERNAGTYSVHWNGRNDRGEEVGSGAYICCMKAREFISTKKMTVAR